VSSELIEVDTAVTITSLPSMGVYSKPAFAAAGLKLLTAFSANEDARSV
jgi:hypothetical protein